MKLNLEEITKKIRRYSINDGDLFPDSEKDTELSAGIEIAVYRRDKESFVVEEKLSIH
jgi:hypothetical protein